ncbi:MAG TPA: ATP synthase F0 subunit B [Candidatus Angelobacter sp.]|nr:ATP synthase F0 subunit B [Candidatus Angelobacter sp.]
MTAHFTRYLSAGLRALVLAAMIFSFAAVHAQESPKPAGNAPAAQASGHESASPANESKSKESGEESDSVRHSPAVEWLAHKTGMSVDLTYWLCIGINFAVIFIFAVVFLRKRLPGYFSGRTASIQKGIEEARRMSEEARQRLSEVEGRLSRLDAEIAAMRNEADENAKAEERRILSASEEERKRIVSSAEQEIGMAANAARRDLKTYAAALAVDLAEKKIRVGKDADQALVREFTAHLGKDGN